MNILYFSELNLITYNECVDILSEKFIIGSMNGNIIPSMKKIISEVYPIAFDKQFIEPKVINHNAFCENDNTIRNFIRNSDPLVNETNALRSSDYHCPQAQITIANEIGTRPYTYDQNMRKQFDSCIEYFGNSIEWFV